MHNERCMSGSEGGPEKPIGRKADRALRSDPTVVVYGASVEIVETMLRKGDPVMVEGRIATRKYSDREGAERSVTEIVVAGPQGMVNVLGPRKPENGDATATGTTA